MTATAKNNDYPEPCTSNLLWFIYELAGEDGISAVTTAHIMAEFNVDSEKATSLLASLLSGFVEEVGNEKYKLTEAGWEEIVLLRKFVNVVNVGAKRRCNTRNMINIARRFEQWLGSKVPEGITGEDATFLARLLEPSKKRKWTEEEIAKGLEIYEKWNGGKQCN